MGVWCVQCGLNRALHGSAHLRHSSMHMLHTCASKAEGVAHVFISCHGIPTKMPSQQKNASRQVARNDEGMSGVVEGGKIGGDACCLSRRCVRSLNAALNTLFSHHIINRSMLPCTAVASHGCRARSRRTQHRHHHQSSKLITAAPPAPRSQKRWQCPRGWHTWRCCRQRRW